MVSAIGDEVLSPWTFLNPVRYCQLTWPPPGRPVSEGTGPIALARFAWAMTRVDGDTASPAACRSPTSASTGTRSGRSSCSTLHPRGPTPRTIPDSLAPRPGCRVDDRAAPVDLRDPARTPSTTTASRTLTLDRPDALNAFTVTMAHELEDAFDRAPTDDDVAAIVVTGAGRAFCAGMDLSADGNVFGLDESRRPDAGRPARAAPEEPYHDGVRDTGGRVTLAIHALPQAGHRRDQRRRPSASARR